MVNALGSAAQQISSNLARLKADNDSKNLQTKGNEPHPDAQSTQDAQSGQIAAKMGSKVSQGLMRLKGAADAAAEKETNSYANIGVDVILSKEARALVQKS